MNNATSPMTQAASPACRNHPDRPARFLCQKFEERFCEECARCPRPTHCKFRNQCLIREAESEGEDRGM